jgi:hypothetical protein
MRKQRGRKSEFRHSRLGTSVRSIRAGALFLLVGMLTLPFLASPVSAHPQPAQGCAYGCGTTGFITRDGLFYVEVGYIGFLGDFNAEPNGSYLYAYAITLNITAIVSYNVTASVLVHDDGTNTTVAKLAVPDEAYSSVQVDVAAPTSHSYVEFRVSVDGTPEWFWVATPYTFLGIPGLEDGGLDLAIFAGIAVFLLLGFPAMLKAFLMTKRAIYAPKWNATMWLHGIFFGVMALYVVDFPQLNMAFHGWEFLFIPIPEVIFAFFWVAGRASTNQQAQFLQAMPVRGHQMGFKSDIYYYGFVDGRGYGTTSGTLVIIPTGRSMKQWYYRSRGHHTRVFVRDPTDPKSVFEPMWAEVRNVANLSTAEVEDPTFFDVGSGRFTPTKGFEILHADSGDDTIDRMYFVKRLSSFKVKWPEMVGFSWDYVEVKPSKRNPDGTEAPAQMKRKLRWPYITDGRAEIDLMPWHWEHVWGVEFGYEQIEDVMEENDNLRARIGVLEGQLYTRSQEISDARINAENHIRNRPGSALTSEEATAYAVRERRIGSRPYDEPESAEPQKTERKKQGPGER